MGLEPPGLRVTFCECLGTVASHALAFPTEECMNHHNDKSGGIPSRRLDNDRALHPSPALRKCPCGEDTRWLFWSYFASVEILWTKSTGPLPGCARFCDFVFRESYWYSGTRTGLALYIAYGTLRALRVHHKYPGTIPERCGVGVRGDISTPSPRLVSRMAPTSILSENF